jgi:hypothetical protein
MKDARPWPGIGATRKMKIRHKALMIFVAIVGMAVLAIAGAYWWANIPPKRPNDLSTDAVFLWAGHLGLPASKHGRWIECWTDIANGVNRCKLIEMNGIPGYEGIFLADTGKNPVPESALKIESEPTGDVTHWIHLDGPRGAPLVFLENGIVLIPKDAYQDGMAKLKYLRYEQRRKP